MIEFVIFVLFIICFVGIAFGNTVLRIKNASLVSKLLKVSLERNYIAEELKQKNEDSGNIINEESEAFLKFISDSRDSAFSYIDEVQSGIHDFIMTAGREIEYWEKYSMPLLLDEQRDTVIQAYNRLKSLIPEDYGKIDT